MEARTAATWGARWKEEGRGEKEMGLDLWWGGSTEMPAPTTALHSHRVRGEAEAKYNPITLGPPRGGGVGGEQGGSGRK